MKAKAFFNQHVIFRFEEFLLAAEKEEGVSVATANNVRTVLHRYCKNGKLLNVRKGLYVVVSDQTYQSNIINPFLVIGKATDDAVIAYHSALESHNIAYTDFNEQMYITSHQTNDFDFQHQHYHAVYHKKHHLNNTAGDGIETITIMGTEIRRTTLARTVVDVLNRPNVSGGWEEVIRSLDRITSFDVLSAVNYALSLKRASIVAKLGYFLENQSQYFKVDSSILNQLLINIPKQPYYIDRTTTGSGIFFKKWKIIVPAYLHERQWEEPNELDN
jgi:predicted transcriptional regulator of viral defense system